MTVAPTPSSTRETTRPISRATAEEVVRNTSLTKLQDSLREFGNERLAQMRAHRTYATESETDSSPGTTIIGDGETTEAFKRDMLEGLTNRLRPELTPLRLDIHPGTQVVAAPYDHSGQFGLGLPHSHINGHMKLLGGDKFSAAGFSFFLTAGADVSVSVTPCGIYEHSFFSLGTYPDLQTQGGAGSVVDGKDGTTLVDANVTLWNRTGISPTTGEAVAISLADVTGMSVDSFPGRRLFPVLFDMHQGDTCEVWLYLWNLCANSAKRPFFCVQSGLAPVVTVEAGPLIVEP